MEPQFHAACEEVFWNGATSQFRSLNEGYIEILIYKACVGIRR